MNSPSARNKNKGAAFVTAPDGCYFLLVFGVFAAGLDLPSR